MNLILSALAVVLFFSFTAHAQVRPPEQRDAAVKSLVVVQYTLATPADKREVAATGVVVREDGLTIVPSLSTPVEVPDGQMKAFKLIVPGREPQTYDAELVGRDERYQLSFIQPKNADGVTFTPIKFHDVDAFLGEQLRSVGLMPVQGGYQAYLSVTRVSANVPGAILQVLVDGAGLTVIGSLVFNTKGQALGLVNDQRVGRPGEAPMFSSAGHSVLLNDAARPLGEIERFPRFYQPATDFLPALQSLPTKDAPIKPGVVGLGKLAELTTTERSALGGDLAAAIRIGEVAAGSPAAAAGVQAGHVVVSVDDKPLHVGTAPGESAQWLQRKLVRVNAGQKLILGIIREPDKPAAPVELTAAGK